MPLSRHSVGIYPETAHTQLVREHSVTVVSVRLATVQTDPGINSGISVRELISTSEN